MKVLVVSHSCVVDVNQQLYVSLRRLPEVQVELLIPDVWRDEYSGEALRPRLLGEVDFPVYSLPVVRPGSISLYAYRASLGRLIAQSRPDVVLLDEEPWAFSSAQVTAACAGTRLPFVCYTKQNILKRYPIPFSWIERQTLRQAATMAVVTEEVGEVVRAKGYAGPCPLLPHACELSLFAPRPNPDLRAKLGLRGTVIGYMGRFVPEKGVDLLIAAAALLGNRENSPTFSLLLVGSGSEEASLREQVRVSGVEENTVLAGSVPHRIAAAYMNCMDVLVVPSRTTPTWKEQFGRVIVEAMACGVPVIGSDSGAIPHLIRDTGGGLVFREGNARDLQSALLALLLEPERRQALGEAGRQAVAASYSYDAVARRLHGILNAAIPSLT